MANIMNPLAPVGGIERSAPSPRSAHASGDRFSDHLDRKIQDQVSRNDKVGVKQQQRKQASSDKTSHHENRSAKREESQGQRSVDAEAVATLALFMQDLQQIAKTNGLGVGEWVASMDGGEFMEGFAAHAGMSELDLMALAENFQAQDGSLDLPSFFQALQEHFEGFDLDPSVLVPETELPLLESLLTKMGLNQEQLAAISDAVVVGDGELDLGKLTEVLTAIMAGDTDMAQTGQPVTLSGTEIQQLQDLLGKAGLNLGQQLELLPEPLLGKEVVLSLERLLGMLEQGVNEVLNEAPKVDLVAFLGDLESVMQGAKFVDQSAGITPLVQNSLVDVYKNLLDMFEEVKTRFDEGLARDESLLAGDVDKWQAEIAERLASLTGMDVADIKVQAGLQPEVLSSAFSEEAGSGMAAAQPSQLPLGEQSGQVQASADQPQATRHFTPQQQQQIFNQLSLAVARGMKSGEHHLTLRLHPAELGDVKVDLVMKGDEISAHFNIANSKVKETLETSLDEFRQDMEQKGFILGELNVSVGGQEDPGEAWQRFEMAWSGERLQAETLEDLPDTILYQHGKNEQYAGEQGVNLFV